MKLLEELINYSNDIISGKIMACTKHRWACKRFLNNLDNQGTERFPFVFSESKAENFMDWMRLFKHSKGVLQGQHIEPHIIQKFVFGNVFGWIHKDTGLRRYRKMYWQVARKNAKSQSLAAVGLYELMADHENSSEVYTAGVDREQSQIVWDEAVQMLNGCKELQGKYRVAYGKIYHDKSHSKMVPLSKEKKKSGDGSNPQCGICDEFHAHSTTEFYDILSSGKIARKQPLMVIITTAGFNLNYPCARIEYPYVSKILDPNSPVSNEGYFVMVNELEKGDDIKDEKNWSKANPIVCSYPEGVASIREEEEAAIDVPEKMRNYLTKNMNIWVDLKENGYMIMDKWAACGVDQMPDLRNSEGIVGIDLSAKIDLTSVSFDFALGDDKFAVYSHSFIPEDTLARKMKTDNVPYSLWAKQGWITVTPGAVVDYRFIKTYIMKQKQEQGWLLNDFCYDPYNGAMLAQEMEDEGFEPIEVIQGMKTLSEPTKNFREAAYLGNIVHGKNPVLTWAVGNAVIRMDHNENIMLDKDKSTERIDPIASLIDAHTRAIVKDSGISIYESRGVLG